MPNFRRRARADNTKYNRVFEAIGTTYLYQHIIERRRAVVVSCQLGPLQSAVLKIL